MEPDGGEDKSDEPMREERLLAPFASLDPYSLQQHLEILKKSGEIDDN